MLLRDMLGDAPPMVGRVLSGALRPAAAQSLFLIER
jgi:hypothetical protein